MVTEDAGDILRLAEAATMATVLRLEPEAAMARPAVVVTDLPGAEEVTDPLPVAVTAPCVADGHRLPRATKDLKVRMIGGLRPLDRTVKALTAPTEHPLVRPPPPAT